MAKEKEEEEKVYRKPVLFLYKSKAGKHLYAFNSEREDGKGEVLGGEVESLIVNISDVEKVVSGEWKSTKVSVMYKEEAEG